MSSYLGRKVHVWYAAILHALALIGLTAAAARADEYEDWLGIG